MEPAFRFEPYSKVIDGITVVGFTVTSPDGKISTVDLRPDYGGRVTVYRDDRHCIAICTESEPGDQPDDRED